MRTYGYTDEKLVNGPSWNAKRIIAVLFALLFLSAIWFGLTQKLLFGSNWLSDTYDNEDWRTNEGNLHTFGAWDIETHIWKSQYIMEHYPNYRWNPYWYMGMPLVKYYQLGFYALSALLVGVTGLHVAKATTFLVIFGHLLATLLTFLVCYKVSRRIWVSAFASSFILSNTFISLRSYGWEPITVVFLFLYPLGLLFFLRQPLKPFRISVILVLAAAYLGHPLLWFSLCMTMGIYLFSIAIRHKNEENASKGHYIWSYIGTVIMSVLIGAIQFIPQMSYEQVTSGAHMGVKYIPYYQVPTNIISLIDFFLDMGNLKGPGPIVMIAFILLIALTIFSRHSLSKHDMTTGFALILAMMVLFYYLELYNIFPMNFLRSIQYHRIIPEFIITAAVMIAAMSNIPRNAAQKSFFYAMLIAFSLASLLVVYNVQDHWATSDEISDSPEFIHEPVEGRISFPYTDQSLSVRNSFTSVPQTYGYYEQGITNPYADELFSVSSGFHNHDMTLIYLKAANVGRLYINMEEGRRDQVMHQRLNGTLPFIYDGGRYGYFQIPLDDPSFVQTVSRSDAERVKALEPGCRMMFMQEYCGSAREEFVSTDEAERQYLRAYNEMLSRDDPANAVMQQIDPEHYIIHVDNASAQTNLVVKMTYDEDFIATIDGSQARIETIGPYFMLIVPEREGSYQILLEYETSSAVKLGALISILALAGLSLATVLRRRSISKKNMFTFDKGDMR